MTKYYFYHNLVLVAQSCPALCNLMGYSPPGSSVHGILQARILEWVVIPFPRRSSQFKSRTRILYVPCVGRWVLYHKRHLGGDAATVAS